MVIISEQEITSEMIEAIENQPIYWSDDRRCHWFFDFKFDEKWVSSKYINNELTQIHVTIYEGI